MRKLLTILMSVFMLAMLIPVSGMASNGIAETTIETNNTDGITLAGFASRKLTNGYTQSTRPFQFVGFNSSNPGATQALLSMSNLESNAATIIGDVVYAFAHNYSSEYDDIGNDKLYRINTNGSWTSTPIGTGYDYLNVMSLTYAADTDTLYALVNNEDDVHDHLMIVDRTAGTLAEVVDLTDAQIRIKPSIAYIGNGRFFAIHHTTGNGMIFNLEGELVQELGNTLNTQFETVYSMYYDSEDGLVYAAMGQMLFGGTLGKLITIDVANGAPTELAIIGQGCGYVMTSIFPVPGLVIDAPNTPSQEEFDAAVNAEGSHLTFTNDRGTPWEIVSENGRTYVRSTIQDQHSSSTTITAVFNGLTAGQALSFDWSVSSESNYDWMGFYVNGTRVQRISGSQSFTTYTYTVPSDGSYTFKWTYSKDSSVSSGSDCAGLDNVSITGTQPEPIVAEDQLNEALNVPGGSIEFIDDPVNPWGIDTSENGRMSITSTITGDNQHQVVCFRVRNAYAGDAVRFDWKTNCEYNFDKLNFRINSAKVDFITGDNDWETYTYIIPTDGDYVFTWEYSEAHGDTRGNGSQNAEGNAWIDNVEYIREYGDPYAPAPNTPEQSLFDAAINAPGENRSFNNDLTNPWQVTTEDGRNCVVSDIAGMPSTETEFSINLGYLEEGTVISFDWKTDCESDFDLLSLTFNGGSYLDFSGQNNWTTQTVTLQDSGYYVIGWRYYKNHVTDSYTDKVWVDNVKITPVRTLTYHTATFVDGYDNSVIMAISVPDGYYVNYPSIVPVHLGYQFVGWEGQIEDITTDVTITAVYVPRGEEPPVGLLGDVNGDGVVNMVDATNVLRHGLGIFAIQPSYLHNADVNGDGVINTVDATLIIRMCLGLN